MLSEQIALFPTIISSLLICDVSLFRLGLSQTLQIIIDWFLLQQPFRCEIEHKLGVSCVNSGPVVCRVSLDRGGYVPGETIGISATVENHSKVTIKYTKASLTEVIFDLALTKGYFSSQRFYVYWTFK